MFEKTKQKLHNFKVYIKEGWSNLKSDPKGWAKRQWKKVIILVTGATIVMAAGGGSPDPEYITAPENNAYRIGVMNYEYAMAEYSDEGIQYKDDGKFIELTPSAVYIDGHKVLNANRIQKVGDRYPDLFDAGVDLDLLTKVREWTKLITLNSEEILQYIPQDALTIEIEFEVETDFIIDGWNKEDYFEINDTVRLGDYSYIEPAHAWDSYSEEICEEICEEGECWEECETLINRIKLTSYLEKRGNKLYYTKVIPVDWLRDALFPVYTDLDVDYGTPSYFTEVGDVAKEIRIWELDIDKFVVFYFRTNSSSQRHWIARVATVSGTSTIDWGDDIEVVSAYNNSNTKHNSVAKLETDKFVAAWCGTNGDGFTAIGNVSGTNITMAASLEYETGDVEFIDIVPMSATKFVIAYVDDSDDDKAKAVTCTIDGGDNIGCGNIVVAFANDSKDVSAAKLDTDKFVMTYQQDTGDSDGFSVVGEISGDTTSLGEPELVHGALYTWDTDTIQADIDKFWVLFAYGGHLYATANTVDSTDIIQGTKVLMGYYEENNSSGVALDDTHLFIVAPDDNDNDYGKSHYTTTTWATKVIEKGAEETFAASALSISSHLRNIDVSLIDSDKIVTCYTDIGDSSTGKCLVGFTPSVEEPPPAGGVEYINRSQIIEEL